MFATLCGLIPRDPGYPERTWRLDVLGRVLAGTLYDVLPYDFHEERTAGGEYVPLRSRRPSVRWPLARIVVDDTLSLLFGHGHAPRLASPDRETAGWLTRIGEEAGLGRVMLEAARAGSVGSVAVLLRVLGGRVAFSVLPALYLTPEFDPLDPARLVRLTEAYKVRGAVLAAQGYEIAEPGAFYWFRRVWDADSETWFLPQKVGEAAAPLVDEARSVRHGLGFVPAVWVRNLPGGEGVDGASTFAAGVETSIEIDYQLSQAGRGLKYSSDPTLLIKEPAGIEGDLLRGAGNALVLSEKGDARLLEINGAASAAVIDYVRTLRELALEAVHGNRASPERLAAAQSGRALEMMNQGLIWVAEQLRVSYGAALLGLLAMVARASHRYALRVGAEPVPALALDAGLSLVWPPWYPPDGAERAGDAAALERLAAAGLIARETAASLIARLWGLSEAAPAPLDANQTETQA